MNVLLISPSQYLAYGYGMNPAYPPLGLLSIASVFEDGDCQVRFVDMDAERFSLSDLGIILDDFKPDIVGITSLTPTFNNALAIAKIVKNSNKDAKVILGGIHVTISPLDGITNDYVDFVIEGEGEVAARELVTQLKSAQPDWAKVGGLWYKKDGKVVNNPKPPLINDLNTIKFPARHLIKDFRKYTGQDVLRMPIANIITSRGCPGRCTYCQTKQIFGRNFRFRSVENIIAEIDLLVNKFKVKEIHIVDDVFTLHKARVLRLCDEIRKRKYGLTFQIANGLRADMVDEDILRALKSIGLLNVGFGVETGSESILKKIKKDEITKDKTRDAFKIAKRLGFETWGFFIIGLPDDTKETIRETIGFAKELEPDYAKFLILKPYPGSEVFDELSSKGLIFDHDYDNYGAYTPAVHRLESLTEHDILYWQKKAFREFYFRPLKLLRFIFREWTLVRLRKTFIGLKFILSRST